MIGIDCFIFIPFCPSDGKHLGRTGKHIRSGIFVLAYADFPRSEQFAAASGSTLVDRDDAGHINTASGHGAWPEGHQLLTDFVARIT